MKTLVLVLVAYCTYYAVAQQLECDTSEISCENGDRCITQRYICDRDNDCDDGSDETSALCEAWRNDNCDRNEVQCSINGESNCVTVATYCSSEECQPGDLDRRICKMLKDGVLKDLDKIIIPDPPPPVNGSNDLQLSGELADKFRSLIPYTLRHRNCPPMYTWVGDQCLSIFHIGSMSWGEAREFCRILKGDLITFRNISHYAAVVQHLQKYDLSSNFWIGGRLENASLGWTWVDETPMELGSPYWVTRYSTKCVDRNLTRAQTNEECFHYYQAPEEEPLGQCVSLSFEQFFYMGDADCIKKMSPLCVFQDRDPWVDLRGPFSLA